MHTVVIRCKILVKKENLTAPLWDFIRTLQTPFFLAMLARDSHRSMGVGALTVYTVPISRLSTPRVTERQGLRSKRSHNPNPEAT